MIIRFIIVLKSEIDENLSGSTKTTQASCHYMNTQNKQIKIMFDHLLHTYLIYKIYEGH